MTSDPTAAADAATARTAVRLTRGITATWWYTFGALVFFELMLVFVWVTTLLVHGASDAALAMVGFGGIAWVGSTIPPLLDYRHRVEGTLLRQWRRVLIPLAFAGAFGVVAGLLTGVWIIAALPFVQSVVLLNWPPGVRPRVVGAGTLVLAALWIVDANVPPHPPLELGGAGNWWLLNFYSAFLPAMSVVSLWWWDVLVTLDRARASEARLAATQERLHLATDVHDLQGHHLQVIALQLELAERLLSRDPDAALQQLHAARASVDEARQGTRDLATRYRSVPLRDELANAADLLIAAGTPTEVSVGRDADLAPADVLGPVIRETTTNALRHGGGGWAKLALSRSGALWRYEISNDAPEDPDAGGDGAGLNGLARRAADAGGTLDIVHDRRSFTVTMTVPASGGDGVVITVLIADDEAMIRSALAALLRLEDDIEVVAECSDGAEAVAEATRLSPDICLLDLEMPGLDGVEVAERLRKTVATKCIVVTRHARPGVLRRALASGVSGFLPKSRGADEVAAVIRRVAGGARYVDPEVAADALSDERCPLTDRELDVLRAGRRGETTGQIARSLSLAPGTVRNHISAVLGKLSVGTRQQATLIAEERGWL